MPLYNLSILFHPRIITARLSTFYTAQSRLVLSSLPLRWIRRPISVTDLGFLSPISKEGQFQSPVITGLTLLIPCRQEDEQISGWEELWDAERSDLWDRGKPSAPLRQLIEELDSGGLKRLQHGRLKALVPGCGRGYDVVLLALHGFDAYGLEVSSTAISAAQKYAERQLVHPSDEYFGPNTDKSRWGKPGEAQFIEGDFFSDFWEGKVDKGTGFDVIYDYTVTSLRFGCSCWKSH